MADLGPFMLKTEMLGFVCQSSTIGDLYHWLINIALEHNSADRGAFETVASVAPKHRESI